ncbi:MAG: hypothetical protein Q8N62_03780 [Candidatus Omnitrophota bacterium]|nr:hypothetical protein [Candidatus Omnitrophota bacterium]
MENRINLGDDPEGFYKILKKDSAFKSFEKIVGPISLESLNNEVEGIILREEVPDQVKEVFDISKKLFVLSYFKYRLFTVAAHYGFLAMEAALTLKYQAEYVECGRNLYSMIQKLIQEGLLPAGKHELYDAGRCFRNELSHLSKRKVLTPGMVPLKHIGELINDLFTPAS